MKNIKGFLIDLDGVLYIEDRTIPGAVDAVNWLREKGYPFRFLTSTTMHSRDTLVALQKGRYWQKKSGLAMDAGAFMVALEYATETAAELIGKPNRAYFDMALADLALDACRVAMIGDSIGADIIGAQAVGMATILVRTGQYVFDAQHSMPAQPDWTIDSIADLPGLVGE